MQCAMGTRPNSATSLDLRSSQFHLRIARSKIHGWGLFAYQRIPRGRIVIKYDGERLSLQQFLARLKGIRKRGGRMPRYVVRMSKNWFVDGSIGGSGAERVNHSCDPNLQMRLTSDHAVLISRRWIKSGEELTWDYRFPRKAPLRRCNCGSSKCRRSINLR